MAASSQDLRLQAYPLERKVKGLLNADLKAICKSEGLLVSGVKSALQMRILERLNDAVDSGDSYMFNQLRARINAYGTPLPSSPTTHHSQTPHTPQHQNNDPYRTMPNGYHRPGVGANLPSHGGHGSRLHFKPSPFYTILESLTGITELPVTSARNTSQAPFSLSHNAVDRLRNDKSLRIMVYCAIDPGAVPYPVDIAFPNQVEVRVNSEVYSGNLKGIKKKPGTTRPADITDLTRKANSYMNTVVITYAATDRVHNPSPSKYCMIVYLVRKHSVEELVDRIKRGHVISKQTVINEMLSKAKDPDIVTTSTVMSLKCPLSTMRMTLPCRSTVCNHNQCFDATSFLQVQEQAPQWTCPTCNKFFNFDALAVDQYVQDILSRVPKSVDQVKVEPDGNWKQDGQSEDFRIPTSTAKRKLPSEFDDFIEVTDPRTNGFRGGSSTPQSYARTPATDSREASRAASSVPRPSSSKKPAEEVIDLTADDDEDDEDDQPPRRTIKRQSTSSYVGQSAYSPQVASHRLPSSFSFNIPTTHNQPPTQSSGYGTHYNNNWG